MNSLKECSVINIRRKKSVHDATLGFTSTLDIRFSLKLVFQLSVDPSNCIDGLSVCFYRQVAYEYIADRYVWFTLGTNSPAFGFPIVFIVKYGYWA